MLLADGEEEDVDEDEVIPDGAEYSNINPFFEASRTTEHGKLIEARKSVSSALF